MISCKIMLS